MDVKAQISIYGFMLMIIIVLLVLAFAFPVYQITTYAMNESSSVGGMNCSSATVDDFTKAACWVVDFGMGYYVGALLAFAGIIIGAKIIFS